MAVVTGPVYHGWTHRRGGTDPVPQNEPTLPPLTHPRFEVLDAFGILGNLYMDGTDVAELHFGDGCPNDGYLQTDASGAIYYLPIMVSRQGLAVHWSLGYGPDFGRITIGIASVVAEGGPTTGSPAYVDHPSSMYEELYTATPDTWDATPPSVSPLSNIALAFQMEDPDAEYGKPGTNLAGLQWDGGPGPHWLRIRVNGKDGSSSGYKTRLYGLVIGNNSLFTDGPNP